MAKNKLMNKGIGKATGLAFNDDGSLNPKAEGAVQRLLSVQRPAVLAYLRNLRRRHPDASPAEIAEIVRVHYINLSTGGGAAVGATAIVPGIGTGAAMGVAAVETAGFLEGSALYAQAVAELHGLPVRDPERANALVMGMMLGSSGRDLVKKFSGQAAGTGPALTANWGPMVAKQVPSSMLGALTKRMRRALLRKYAAKAGGSYVGRVLPFGVGAVIGGVVNRKMAKTVVEQAQSAFGPFPAHFEHELDPQVSTPHRDSTIVGGLRNIIRLKKKRQSDVVIDGDVADQAETGDGQQPPSSRSAKRRRKARDKDRAKGRAKGRVKPTGRNKDRRKRVDKYAVTGNAQESAGAHGNDPANAGGAGSAGAGGVAEAPHTYRPDVRL